MSALEFFTGFITVFEDPVWDWIAGGILVTVSGSIAYAIGGQLGYSGKIGWFLWLITAVAVYAVIACIIRAIMWLIALPLVGVGNCWCCYRSRHCSGCCTEI